MSTNHNTKERLERGAMVLTLAGAMWPDEENVFAEKRILDWELYDLEIQDLDERIGERIARICRAAA